MQYSFKKVLKMETFLPQAVAKKRVLPQWMLESTNQQHAHTTTTRASSYKKQKRNDSFYGHIKHRVPQQDMGNSNKKIHIDYLEEKQRDQRPKESLEEKVKRLRKYKKE